MKNTSQDFTAQAKVQLTEKSISRKSLMVAGGNSRNLTTELRQSATQREQKLGDTRQSPFILRKKSSTIVQNPASEAYMKNLNQTKNYFRKEIQDDSFTESKLLKTVKPYTIFVSNQRINSSALGKA